MECADYLIAAGRSTASGPSRWSTTWRKAANVIRACHRLARSAILSSGILRRTGSYVAINIRNDDDGSVSDSDDAARPPKSAAAEFFVAADDVEFKDLVKEKRFECFDILGGGRGIAWALASGTTTGIRGDEEDVRRRREAFGGNTYPRRRPEGFWSHVWAALSDVFLVVLLLCAAVSLGFGIKGHGAKGGWYDAVCIFVAVLLIAAVSAAVSAVSDRDQMKHFNLIATEWDSIAVTVVRDRRRQVVKMFDVVVGDVVVLKIDDIVPADGVCLEGLELQVSESSMTDDEPQKVLVDAERNPFLAAGVKVINGQGLMLVTAVGIDTAWGKRMSRITAEDTDPTPLQKRLEGFSSRMGKVRNVFAVLTALYFTGSNQGGPLFDKQHMSFKSGFSGFVGIFQPVMTIVVVAIPEGLLLAVKLTLAFFMKRMVKEHALVRRLSACETMGSVTTICANMNNIGMLRLSQIKKAIEACTKAGVAIVMVTGDSVTVAAARTIAKECGIISKGDYDSIVIEGHEFRAMWPEQQLEIVDRIRVMARSLPMDKLLLVQRLKQKGHVVAVTGDGTNDAPALKEADIGLSMGVRGAEVAKESSDIIILDDNFNTVVTAISWGRCIYNNIQKFIQFHLTANIVALAINFVSAVTTGEMPLTTVHLLWVNLVMDTMGALALATGAPTRELMRRRPIAPTAPLISYAMWRNLATQAAFQVAALLSLKYRGCNTFGTSDKANDAMISNAFVLCQLFNAFNARDIHRTNVFAGVLHNRLFIGVIAMTIATHVVMVEALTRFMGTVRIGWAQWGACVAIAVMSWPIGWATKFIPVSDTDQYCSCVEGR